MSTFPMDNPVDGPYRSVRLPCDRTAPRTARALAVSAIETWGLLEIRDDVELVVSELVANALRLATRIAFLIALRSGTDQIEVAVWDDGPGIPEPSPQCPDAESGRGLLIVNARSNSWGCTPGRDGLGKTTWARLGPKPHETLDEAT